MGINVTFPAWLKCLGQAIKEYVERGLGHWGASVAFYTVFSLPPLLITLVSIAAAVLGPGELDPRQVIGGVEGFLTPAGVEIVAGVLSEVEALGLGSATAVPFALLMLVAGTAVFANVQAALNDIWGIQRAGSPVRQILRSRLISLLTILGIGGVFFASVALTTLAKALAALLQGTLLDELGLIRIVDVSLSGFVYWVLFSTVYRILPDTEIKWRDVLLGGLIAAVLFLLGKELIASFLTRSEGASVYGAAASIFAFLVFIYYSAQLFFVGALYTRLWAGTKGRTIGP